MAWLDQILKARRNMLASLVFSARDMEGSMLKQNTCLLDDTPLGEQKGCTSRNYLGFQRYLSQIIARTNFNIHQDIDAITHSVTEVIAILSSREIAQYTQLQGDHGECDVYCKLSKLIPELEAHMEHAARYSTIQLIWANADRLGRQRQYRKMPPRLLPG
ncbi:hypothetical protein ACEQ8H_006080 [Pleosporales sp. CAS-2024a]